MVQVLPAIAGDFNGDRVVDGADLVKWGSDFGAGAGIHGAHRDDRRIDIGIFPDRQARVRDDAHEDQHQAHDGRPRPESESLRQ